MATFSAGQAIGSGFKLIGREPRAVLVWVVAYALFSALTYGLMFAAMPEMLGYYQEMARGGFEGREPDDAQALAMVSKLLPLAPVFLLVALVSYAVMLGAIYRAVLHPDDRRFAYLRFGRSELMLMLTMVVWTLLITAIYVVVAMTVVIVGAIVAGTAGATAGSPADTGLFLLVTFCAIALGALAMLWIVLRLSLAFPMSHDQARFVIFDSWRLTRGQSLKLLGVGIVLVILVWVIEVVVMLVFSSMMFAAAGGFEAFVAGDPQLLAQRMFAWFPAFALLGAVLGVLMFVILATPIADIYRQLTAPAPDPVEAA